MKLVVEQGEWLSSKEDRVCQHWGINLLCIMMCEIENVAKDVKEIAAVRSY